VQFNIRASQGPLSRDSAGTEIYPSVKITNYGDYWQ